MTKLVKLILKNFKSFKKAEIPISKGFTSIVGSNGSGKSNILDALLFVLGITSLKTLRASKLVDLVNTGSKEGYAKVDLIIKHEEKEYEVSRMIDRQGKSIYRLDGKRTTLNEINSLLLELGIDVSGHNIVTQGDITKIIEMSPIERRMIIDNIAGLSEFDQKKEEAIKELGKVDQKIKEATIILNERNGFLVELEEEMKAAKEFDELEKEKKRIKSTIIGRELYSIEKRMNEILEEIKTLEKQKQICDENVLKIREELKNQKEKSNEMNRQIMKESESLYISIGRAFEEKKGKLNVLKEKVKLQEEEKDKNNKKLENNKKVIENSVQKKPELENKIKEEKNEIKLAQGRIKELAEKKNSIEKIVKEKTTEIKKQETELDEVNKKIEEKRKNIFELEVFVKQQEKQKAFNEKKLSELNEELNNTKQKIELVREKRQKIKELIKDGEIEEIIKKIEEELNNNIEEKNRNESLISQLKKSIIDLEKANSNCPTCESKLEETKKGQILHTKNEHINQIEENQKNILQKIIEIKNKLNIEKENQKIVTKLLIECQNETELLAHIKNIDGKIKEINLENNNKNSEEKIKERENISSEINILFNERESLKEKLNLSRSQNIFEEYSTISRTIEDELNKKSLLESKISNIETEINSLNNKSKMVENENKNIEKQNNEIEKEIKDLSEKIALLEGEVALKDNEMREAKKKSNLMLSEKEKLDKEIERNEKEITIESSKARKFELKINDFTIEKSKIEVRQIDLKEEEKYYTEYEPISEKTIPDLKERLEIVEKRLLNIGAVNLKAIENFAGLKKEVDEIQKKAEKLNEERLAVLDMIDKIEVKRTNVFMECFNEVNKNFSDMFFKFFNGEGKLTFENQEKPLESGLLIEANPKKGKLQNIDSMSGGEKTLTALAFMFAIQLYSPAPFYAFDEADAALDKENSAKMGNLIEMIAQKSQFISVTHNDTITKKADQIIGVALAKDGSSVIGLKLKNN